MPARSKVQRMDAFVMPFGKYKGRPITELEDSYLSWLMQPERDLYPDTKAAVAAEAQRRGAAAPGHLEAAPSPAQTAPEAAPVWTDQEMRLARAAIKAGVAAMEKQVGDRPDVKAVLYDVEKRVLELAGLVE